MGVEGLDLALFVDAQDQGAIRRRQTETHDIAHFVDEQRVARQLERLAPMRLQAERANSFASVRVLQWVASRGVVLSVSIITCSTCASMIRRGPPGRGSSTTPSSRFSTKRRRHRPAVCRVIRNSAAISEFDRPAAHARNHLRPLRQALRRGPAPHPLLERRPLTRTDRHAYGRASSSGHPCLLVPEVREARRIRFRISDPGH